jgi:hypothetical protein
MAFAKFAVEFVKSRKTPFFVIPAEVGIQSNQVLLDLGVRRGDSFGDFLRSRQVWKAGSSIKRSIKRRFAIEQQMTRSRKKCPKLQSRQGFTHA